MKKEVTFLFLGTRKSLTGIEYGMENHRFFDLVRQGRAGQVLRDYAEKYNTAKGKNFRDGINELFPIPQTEIDLSQGKLVQNPGY